MENQKRIVIAEGKVTGNAHAIYDIEKVESLQDNILKIKEPVELTHEEHDSQLLEEGEYTIGIVKQFNPLNKEIEKVRD